jgi:hypothetical protein
VKVLHCGVMAMTLIVASAVACTAAPSASAPPTESPAERSLLPLPPHVDGIPRPGDASAVLRPQSPAGIVRVGVTVNFILGHCGLGSPIDLDGALWDPIAGDNGFGGPLTEQQMGELVNSTTVALTLLDPNRAAFVTPRGAVLTLDRHAGPRMYLLCM